MRISRLERAGDWPTLLKRFFAVSKTRLWTALPGIVQSFDPARMTVRVQPALDARVTDERGETKPLHMPPLLDCPVLWQGGGGATLTFPVKAGDECLVIFSARCIDSWFVKGGVQPQDSLRTHDLADGFALVGVRSLPRNFAINESAAELRSDDGSTFVRLDPAGQLVTVTSPGGINLNGLTIDSEGNLVTAGDVTSKGKVLASHTHSGVAAGGATTGPPS